MNLSDDFDLDLEVGLAMRHVVRRRSDKMDRLQIGGIVLPVQISATWNRVMWLPQPAFVQGFEELLRDPDGYVRVRAAWILRNFDGRRSVAVLVKALSSDEPHDLRKLALECLDDLEPYDAEEALPALCKLLVEENDSEIQLGAISSIKSFGWDIASAAAPTFGQALKNQFVEIRREVCSALGWLGIQARGLTQDVFQVATQDVDRSVRQAATQALICLDPEGELFIHTEIDESLRVRLTAQLCAMGEDGRHLRLRLLEVWRPDGERSAASVQIADAGRIARQFESVSSACDKPKVGEPAERTRSKLQIDVKLKIERSEDLAIGIYEDGGYYAFGVRPEFGDVVTLAQAVLLPLKGRGRWPNVLTLLAYSRDGRRARKIDLITELGYRRGSGLPLSKLDLELPIHHQNLGKAHKSLVGAMADLGRELRSLIEAPEGCLTFDGKTESEYYIAPFVAGFLMKNMERRIQFTRPE